MDPSDYDFYYGYSTDSPVVTIIYLIVAVLAIIGQWKLYKKAGYQGWESLIPFYNTYVLFDIVYGQGWYFLICLIPIVGWVFAFVTLYKLARVYGKSPAFGWGLVFLSSIFLIILGFSNDAYYCGPSVRARAMGVGNYNAGGYGGNYGGYNNGYNNDYNTYGGNNQQGYPNNGFGQQQGYPNNNGFSQQQDYQNNNGYNQQQGYQNNGFQNNGFQAQDNNQYNPFENNNNNNNGGFNNF